jgi:hypothetical protein
LRAQQKKQRRVDELKDRLRILIETPLFVNAELIKQGVFKENSRIL